VNRVLCLMPSWLLIGCLLMVPLAIIATISLTESGPYGGILWAFTMDSYRSLLVSTDFTGVTSLDLSYVIILLRSLVIAGATTFICLLIGFPAAYFISRQARRHRNLLVLLIAAPFWTDLLVRIYAWIILLSDDGLVHSALSALGLGWLYRHILYTNSAILLGMIYNYLPLMVLPLYASLEKLDSRLTEAAADLYASRLTRLWHIIIRLSMPGIVSGCLLVFIPAIGDFITPTLLGGGKNLLLGNLVALQFNAARNWPFGAAIAVVVLALAVLAGVVSLSLRRRTMEEAPA
jgi:spermidine/putrescine transport system permease protein